ncbi:MAG: cobalamin-binding protein [Chloroflexi bacterium]|nr:cobalamin-binding protein [Chloroflexota bacterium]
MRICTFLPSATEIVYALGLGDSLFGVSHECDYPADAKSKPKVVRSRFDPDEYTSQEIDRLVSEMMSRGERIYEVDEETLKRARPDLVITQELCEVCAVSFEDVQKAVVRLEMPPQLISLDPHGLQDVFDDIARVGQHTGTSGKAKDVVAGLRGRLDKVRAKAASAARRPKVACVEWLDPLMVAGHWIPEMVEIAGGVDGMAKPGDPTRRIELGELLDYAPDVLILMPCGMDVECGVGELSLLEDLDRWEAMPAVRQGNVYMTDAGGLFSRSGPRLVDGVELLAQMIHPEIFTEPLAVKAARRLDSLPAASH